MCGYAGAHTHFLNDERRRLERKAIDRQVVFGFLVLRLITLYASIMKTASIGNPKGYSGIADAELTISDGYW